MKVLIVLDCFYPNVDGPIEVIVSVAKKFIEKGLGEVELLVPNYPQNQDVEGLKIHRCFSLPSQSGYRASMPALDQSVKKLIKTGGFDIIHVHSPFTLGKYVQQLGKKYGIPVVFTMHTKFGDELERRLKSKALVDFVMNYLMGCINECDYVTTVSKGTVDTLADYGYKHCNDVRVVYNGTSMQPLAANSKRVEELREKYGLNGVTAFIFAGRLVGVKNVQFSLRALAEVKKRGYDKFKFLIVGEGEYGKTLKKLATNLEIAENVIFIGKISDKNELACHYAACDVLLFPSVFDNASIVIMEAAANGLPVATITGTCSAERISDGKNGFVWDNDLEVWTDNIIKLLNDPDAVSLAADGAVKDVYLGWDDIAEEYLQIYKQLLNK